MNAERFFQQEAVLERREGEDPYMGSAFSAPETIKVRWWTENEVVRDGEGSEVVSSARISTRASVRVGDRVTDEPGRERTVVTVRTNRSTRGIVSHTVAWLK